MFFFKLDIVRKVCCVCYVLCLWFNDKRVLIFFYCNNYIFGVKYYLRKVCFVFVKFLSLLGRILLLFYMVWLCGDYSFFYVLVLKINNSFDSLCYIIFGNNIVYILNFIIIFVK